MIENTIISNLINDEDFCRKVIPFTKVSYFTDRTQKVVVEELINFFTKFNKKPTKEIICIELSNRKDLSEKEADNVFSFVNDLPYEETNKEWLVEQTESFYKEKAVYLAIMDSIRIIEGKEKDKTKTAIPGILSDALSVSFDNHIGHNYIEDAEERYAFYHRVEEKIAFDLDMFNKITKGGLSKKTLNVALAGTGVGKSLFMCHVAASCLLQNLNVLYITLEMAEERIAERIDANLFNLSIDELKTIDKEIFNNRINKLAAKTRGTLIVKEYPTASAHSGHFRALLEELKLKKEFTPDIIVIDYLNICASARIRQGANVNSYTYIKSIAEELRGLAVEYDLPILSATQTTRSGYSSSDPGLEDTSESFGLPATVDFMFALISTEELEQMNQIMVKQLKNRYADPSYYKRFIVGIDRSKMKMYDVEVSAQDNISDVGDTDDVPAFDKTLLGKSIKVMSTDEFQF